MEEVPNNKYLIEKIKEYSKSKIILPSREIIDFKEAIIFGFLGVLRLENKNNCLKVLLEQIKLIIVVEIFIENKNF